MRDKVKLFFAMLAIGTFSCGFLNKMMNRQNRILTSYSDILLSIFGERNNETGLMKSCQKDMSRLLRFSKWLFTWDTCEPIRNNKSPWFVERFNTTIQQFLSPLSQGIPRKGFDSWRRLQQNDISYEAFLAFLKKMDNVLPNPQLLFKEKKRECTSCAIVGNSQNLEGSGLGKAIDCHDYVFRINHGPVEGYENDVGTFTTHRFMYPESATKIPPGTGLIFIPFKMNDLKWLNNTLTKVSDKGKSIIATERNKVIVYNPAFILYVHNKWGEKKSRYPSTGFLALIFVLHSCDQVDLFGFGQESHGVWRHYWDKKYRDEWSKSRVHNADQEYETIEKLKDNGIIRILRKQDNIT